jgi:acyl-CoA synthetase (AMP-forming)/AMP-acid ligase II
MTSYLLADQPSVPPGRRERDAFVHRDRAVTFAELDDAATRFASAAHAAGLRPGDRVLLLAPNAIETFEVLVGCARAGLVAVPVNWRLSPSELAGVAADAGANSARGSSTPARGAKKMTISTKTRPRETSGTRRARMRSR